MAEQYADAEDPEEYLADHVFWVPAEARWANLQTNAKRPEITFTDVGDDKVEIRTTDAMSPVNDGGGINLLDPEHDFSVERGTPLELATPTTDAGTTYELTLTD